jgi:hypothetical protein
MLPPQDGVFSVDPGTLQVLSYSQQQAGKRSLYAADRTIQAIDSGNRAVIGGTTTYIAELAGFGGM